MKLNVKNKKRWYYISFAGVVAVIVGLLAMSTSSATPISIVELDNINAGTGYCCDHDGSWSNCPGCTGTTCSTYAASFPYTGTRCSEKGAYCDEAPQGDANGQCEWTLWNDCCSSSGGYFCSWYQWGGCAEYEDGFGNVYCGCSLSGTTGSSCSNRIDCIGDECYI